jgi:hypothetical protein
MKLVIRVRTIMGAWRPRQQPRVACFASAAVGRMPLSLDDPTFPEGERDHISQTVEILEFSLCAARSADARGSRHMFVGEIEGGKWPDRHSHGGRFYRLRRSLL